MNATRSLVAVLQRERPDLHFVISTTTETECWSVMCLHGRCAMNRLRCLGALIAVALALGSGCSSAPKLETRSYQLQRPETEEPLIKSVISDHLKDMGDALVSQGSPSVDAVKTTPDKTAVVRATPDAHRAIKKALDQSRKDAANAGT